jgi:hypothetical protein
MSETAKNLTQRLPAPLFKNRREGVFSACDKCDERELRWPPVLNPSCADFRGFLFKRLESLDREQIEPRNHKISLTGFPQHLLTPLYLAAINRSDAGAPSPRSAAKKANPSRGGDATPRASLYGEVAGLPDTGAGL